jgi:tRNA C32,U32 (ribose-2'-O)-methylase TrmJ
MARAADAIGRGERVGFLFGSEKNGLSNEELSSAHGIITIPTFPGFSSLNLAQAVLLVCYEWASHADVAAGEANERAPTQLGIAQAAWEAEVEAQVGTSARAPLKQLDSLFEWWDEALWQVGFFGGNRAVNSAYGKWEGNSQEEARAGAAMGKLRRLLMRAEPSVGEASLLRGALQAMSKPKTSTDTRT